MESPASTQSAVTRCGRFVSYAGITQETPTCSFPNAVGRSAPSASIASSSVSGRPPRCHSRSTHKLNVYSDEIATVVASTLLGRPIKFCVDRLESFVSDSQARDHRIKCRIALKKTGEIMAMEMDDISAVGAYGMPLRFNVAEGMMAITLAGAPYRFENYQARTRSVYVNKNLIGMYRGVGMPLACVATE